MQPRKRKKQRLTQPYPSYDRIGADLWHAIFEFADMKGRDILAVMVRVNHFFHRLERRAWPLSFTDKGRPVGASVPHGIFADLHLSHPKSWPRLQWPGIECLFLDGISLPNRLPANLRELCFIPPQKWMRHTLPTQPKLRNLLVAHGLKGQFLKVEPQPSLRFLRIHDWKGRRIELPNAFPRLEKLNLNGCVNLPQDLPSLTHLLIQGRHCRDLKFLKARRLRSLEVTGFDDLLILIPRSVSKLKIAATNLRGLDVVPHSLEVFIAPNLLFSASCFNRFCANQLNLRKIVFCAPYPDQDDDPDSKLKTDHWAHWTQVEIHDAHLLSADQLRQLHSVQRLILHFPGPGRRFYVMYPRLDYLLALGSLKDLTHLSLLNISDYTGHISKFFQHHAHRRFEKIIFSS